VDVDALPVAQVEPQRVELTARHLDGEAGAVGGILQRQEDARPALLATELGDLALDPDRRQPLQPRRDPAVERGDAVDASVAVLGRLDLHMAMLARARASLAPPAMHAPRAGSRRRSPAGSRSSRA